jgi:hypothetical protein
VGGDANNLLFSCSSDNTIKVWRPSSTLAISNEPLSVLSQGTRLMGACGGVDCNRSSGSFYLGLFISARRPPGPGADAHTLLCRQPTRILLSGPDSQGLWCECLDVHRHP